MIAYLEWIHFLPEILALALLVFAGWAIVRLDSSLTWGRYGMKHVEILRRWSSFKAWLSALMNLGHIDHQVRAHGSQLHTHGTDLFELARICGELQDARRAAIAVDASLHHDRGYVVMLMPRKGGDLVKVWEIPGGMSMREQKDFINRIEHMTRGEISLMDAPYPARQFPEYVHDTWRGREFQDHVPAGAFPREGWPVKYQAGVDPAKGPDESVVRCSICGWSSRGGTPFCRHLEEQLGPRRRGVKVESVTMMRPVLTRDECAHCGKTYNEHQYTKKICPDVDADGKMQGWLETTFLEAKEKA